MTDPRPSFVRVPSTDWRSVHETVGRYAKEAGFDRAAAALGAVAAVRLVQLWAGQRPVEIRMEVEGATLLVVVGARFESEEDDASPDAEALSVASETLGTVAQSFRVERILGQIRVAATFENRLPPVC